MLSSATRGGLAAQVLGVVGALGALSTLAACTPESTYRYTALTPAARPLAWDGRTAKDGRLRVEGTLSGTRLETNPAPELHDTALHVPEATAEGVIALAVARVIEIGLRFSYASYAWSDVTANGTPPLRGAPSVTGLGPEIRVAFPFDSHARFALGLAGNFMDYSVPYAEWQLTTCTCAGTFVDNSTVGGGARYTLVDQRTENHFALNLGIYPSFNVDEDGKYGHVFAGFSAHTGFKNDGFTNTNSKGSTVEDAGLVFFVGAGYGVEIDPVHLSALVALPLTDGGSPVNYAVSGFVTLGVDIELWESRSERRAHGDRDL